MFTLQTHLPASTATDDPTSDDAAKALTARISAAIGQALAANPCASAADALAWQSRAEAQAGAAQGPFGRAPLLILKRPSANSLWRLAFRHEGTRLDLSTRTRSLTKARAVRATVLAGILAGRFDTEISSPDVAQRVPAMIEACERASAKPAPA